MKKIKVMSVFGTRPEAIKMCPLVLELNKNNNIDSIVCVTGQHRQMLDQVIEIFGINIDYDLNIMRPRQTLTTITSDVLIKMEEVFNEVKPDIVLVHGDTSTSFVVGLSAFYHKIPVGHVEAGLRTFDKYSPFPEEMNRNLTGRIADLHFAPTTLNADNLRNEGIKDNIYITGNTVIDAFKTTVKENYVFKSSQLNEIKISLNDKLILMTAHRRENIGEPLENICKAIKKIAETFKDVKIIYPVHLNPAVREIVNSILSDVERVYLIDPIDVEDMHNLMSRSYLALTDSGGLQEEVPHFGIPVLVLRTETERPEAVEAGTVKVVGIKENDIFQETYNLLSNKDEYDKMARAINPYGDGNASKRIVDFIIEWNNRKHI